MITSKDFDKLIYKEPKLKDDRPKMSKIIGADSEAYTDGSPMMICTSLGHCFKPEKIIDELFITHHDDYKNSNIMLFNMKYDSGSILYHLPVEILKELWRIDETEYNGVKYSYIPHKRLRIQTDSTYINFWDIHQFYKTSLQKASMKYLNKSKLDISTKKFSRKYVARFWNAIKKYCIQDAVLTKELGEYCVDKFEEFGIIATSLYSCASVSFKYFCDHSNIVTSYRFWKHCRPLLEYASDAYEGGKFEITARGSFEGYEYDLTSAYPYEIKNLVDISYADIEYSKTYRNDAIYGFIRVHISNPHGQHLPCGIMKNNVRIYPNGSYYLTITKEEYEYITTLADVDIEHLDGYYLFVKNKKYPYSSCIDELFKVKSLYKGKDPMLYNNSKIVMNSFYGKTCQVIKDKEDGTYTAGAGWNPIYAAIITANNRIRVSTIQNLLKEKCLAVHTDSVISTVPIDKKFITGKIGGFEFVDKGGGILIACGMYQLNNLCAYKGFEPKKKKDNTYETWIDILNKYPNRKKIPYWQLNVESWIDAMAKNHTKDKINVFKKSKKDIDLNCDTKRIWPYATKAKNLLEKLEYSIPKVEIENKNPFNY